MKTKKSLKEIIKLCGTILRIITGAFIILSVVFLIWGSDLKTHYIVMRNDQGQEIRLLGTAHINKDFSGDQAILNKAQEDGSVLFEGIRDEDGLVNVLFFYRVLAQILGVQFQGDYIQYHPSWILSDIPYEVLLQFCKESDIEAQNEMVLGWSDQVEAGKMSYGWVEFMVGAGTFYYTYIESDPLVEYRNYKPILDTFFYLSEGVECVTIYYGEAHLPGFIKHFKKAGFRVIEKETMWPLGR